MPLELLEEADIIFIKQPEIVYAVTKAGDPFYSHSECKTCVFLGIIPNILEDVRMNHTGSKALQPTDELTHPAPFSATQETRDIHVCARLRKRKECGTKLIADAAPVELMCECHQRPF